MELCNTAGLGGCLNAVTYPRQTIAADLHANSRLQFDYLPHAYLPQVHQNFTEALRHNMVPMRNCQSTPYYRTELPNLPDTAANYVQYSSIDCSLQPAVKQTAKCTSFTQLAIPNSQEAILFEKLKARGCANWSNEQKQSNQWNNSSSTNDSKRSFPKLINEDSVSDSIAPYAGDMAQWDVNDPKLPKIRQFDQFTMWPQGQCRYAYQKSASDGARRHASGWAMRNTNNHNAQILKKSCLGVLLCTATGCDLAMRPAICDKARRRQEGRPCCLPGCTGRIFNQPCRGHGGYPVTHFWREHGDTVYFQAKGTHDHVRPDLKPVRDTAARRRRQVQLGKLQQSKEKPLHVAVEDCKMDEQIRPHSASQYYRKRKASDVEIPNGITNQYPLFIHLKTEQTTLQSNGYYQQLINSNIPRYTKAEKLEPIFPKLHVNNPPTGNQCLDASATMTTSIAQSLHQPTFHCSTTNHLQTGFENQFYCQQAQLDCNIGQNSLNSDQCLNNPDNLIYLKQNRLVEDGKPCQPNFDFYPKMPLSVEPVSSLTTASELTTNAFYKHYINQNFINHANNISAGGNSESTSGGLNASWSTPSPPTAGNSSLFGSDFKTMQNSGLEEITSNLHCSVATEAHKVQKTTPVYNSTANWNNDGVKIVNLGSISSNSFNNSGLATPTHHYSDLTCATQNSSPDEEIAKSAMISASTPVSNGQIRAGCYATGYIPPIVFNSSESRGTSSGSELSSEHN